MKIVVLSGSPHKKGTSALLVDEFIRGAKENGHEVFRFDAAYKKVNPCRACDGCLKTGNCIQQDDMYELYPHLLEADYVVFASPLYYFGFATQLKVVIDRFFSINEKLMGSGKRAILLATCHNPSEKVMRGLVATYEEIIHYEQWENARILLATGVGVREDIKATEFPDRAYEIGKRIE